MRCEDVREFEADDETHGRSIWALGLLASGLGEVSGRDHHRLYAWADTSTKLGNDVRPYAAAGSLGLNGQTHKRQSWQIQSSCDVDAPVSKRPCCRGTDNGGVLASENLQVHRAKLLELDVT